MSKPAKTNDTTTGTMLLASVAFVGLLLSRVDGPWWLTAGGVVVMLVMVWAGSRMVFFGRNDESSSSDS